MNLREIQNKQRGVAILFAVLLVTIILTISLSLFNITLKQIILSAVARESNLAFYAADSARNCVLHWDVFPNSNNPFGYWTSDLTGVRQWHYPNSTPVLSCGNEIVALTNTGVNSNPFVTTFATVFNVSDPSGFNRQTCALVTVTKSTTFERYDSSTQTFGTIIDVRGYNNFSGTTCPVVNSRTVERANRVLF